jgi:hypothetical protein
MTMEGEEDGFILVEVNDNYPPNVGADIPQGNWLSEIDETIDGLEASLWPLNKFIHEHPELAFEERQAHAALTRFMQSQPGWTVTKSAYGLETAWIATYDSGRTGPVVSFNVEMGMGI